MMSLVLPNNIDDAERELLQRADFWRRRNISAAMTPEDVRAVHRAQGVDFATAVLYTHFATRLPMEFHAAQSVDPPATGETPRIAIAPGAFHEHYPQLGADGRSVSENAKLRGWESCVIPTRGLGTLDENATAIIDWFDARPHETFTVIAISKGAADMRVALRAAARFVAADSGLDLRQRHSQRHADRQLAAGAETVLAHDEAGALVLETPAQQPRRVVSFKRCNW